MTASAVEGPRLRAPRCATLPAKAERAKATVRFVSSCQIGVESASKLMAKVTPPEPSPAVPPIYR